MTKKGYKQSPEHIEKRKRFGAEHPNWKGDNVTVKSGRSRAIRAYPGQYSCEICGKDNAERHHLDSNTANNEPSNIEFLCRKCHMTKDGRLESYRELIRQVQPMGVRARWSNQTTQQENGND